MRLSREDAEKECSESIENQRRLLRAFVKEQGFQGEVIEFTDDGYSGTSFERPGFQRLIGAIECGLIGCVVVKDLSRLGREYIETGYYVERYFPMRGVRFIAVNDQVDTAGENQLQGSFGLLMSFKNLINEEYTRDISVKVRTALRAKKEQGLYACPFAPYGLEQREGKLTRREEEACVVESIYRWREQGTPVQGISDRLNFLLIPPPTQAKQLYSGYYNGREKSGRWSYQSVYRILHNPIYGGMVELCRSQRVSHKVKRSVPVPDGKRVRFSIEPLIREQRTKEVRKKAKTQDFVLSGFVRCGGCGHKMYQKNGSTKEYLVCSTYKKGRGCTSHTFEKKKVLEILEQVFTNTTGNDRKKSWKECLIVRNNTDLQDRIDYHSKTTDCSESEQNRKSENMHKIIEDKMSKTTNENDQTTRISNIFNIAQAENYPAFHHFREPGVKIRGRNQFHNVKLSKILINSQQELTIVLEKYEGQR